MFKDNIKSKFTTLSPLFLTNHGNEIKLEMKPYLQPFEQDLAIRELKALLGENDKLTENNGLFLLETTIPVHVFHSKLTYWQRVGYQELEPTEQKILEFTQSGLSNFTNRNELHKTRRLRYGPHDLHEYRGKFFPQLVRSLINISRIPDKSIIMDPMCGSGTTTCEAVVQGMAAIGADLNPLSVLIASVKSEIPCMSYNNFREKVSSHIDNIQFPKVNKKNMWEENDLCYLERWFSSDALDDIASILSSIYNLPKDAYRDLFYVCLSNIIRSVSWQKESDLRVRKEIKSYTTGEAQTRFIEELKNQCDKIEPYLCVLNLEARHKKHSIKIKQANAVNIASIFPEYKHKVDLLITSPPYATALPYLDTDRLSLIALKLLARKNHKDAEYNMVGTREISEKERQKEWENYQLRKHELPNDIVILIDNIAKVNHQNGIGFRRRNLPALLGKYFLSMLDAMHSAHKLMKPNSYGFYVVGNNSTEVDGKKIIIPTDDFLYQIGEHAGWTPIEKIPMELLSSRDIFRENRGSSETILCFKA
ncbi:hypothetical protein AB7X03_10865 [Providencia rettgeri]